MNYRQGDIAYINVKELPELEPSNSNVLLQEGSGGNPHSFTNGKFYPKEDGQIIGYLKAENTTIHHVEHNPKGDSIEDGIYEIRRQVEDTHDGLKPVID